MSLLGEGASKDGPVAEKGKFANGGLVYFDDRDKDFAPRMDDRHWESLPLETRVIDVKEKMGRRDYIHPFGMYGSLMERNAEIREDRGGDIFFIERRDKRQGLRRSDLMIAAGVEGIREEMERSSPSLQTETNKCSYLQEMMGKAIYISSHQNGVT